MKKYDAFGTQLQMGDGAAPEVFTAVAGLTNIEGPGGEREVRNATTHDSPNKAHEKRSGLFDAGQVSIEGYYDPADPTHVALIGALEDGELHNFKVIDVDDGAQSTAFTAFVQSWGRTAPHDDMLGFSATLEVTGIPARTP
jgi:predicted secreted protein